MENNSPKITTPKIILDQMRDLIHKESGMIFTPVYIRVLDQRVISICKESGCEPKDILEYIQNDVEFLREFVGHVTTNHTHFFRSMGQYNILTSIVLPDLIKRNAATKKITFWSAASSSGEEAYTTAMVINDFLIETGNSYNWKYLITATDIDHSMLRVGSRARYGIETLRHIPEKYHKYLDIQHNIIDRNFDDGNFTIKKEIKDRVEFSYYNLMEEPPSWSFDIIFCRNVLIYFNDDTKKAVVKRLTKTLKSKGYFFVSPSETLSGISDEFDTTMTPAGIFYIKKV